MFKSAQAAEDFDDFMKDKYDDQKISESDNDDIKDTVDQIKKQRSPKQKTQVSKKRKPAKKWKTCVGMQNCLLFCFPHKMDQEQLIQDDMEINIRYLMSTPMLKKENLKKVNDDI